MEKLDIFLNTGFREDPISPDDFTFGAIEPEDRNPTGNWLEDLPSEERQSNTKAEYMNCVSQSANNCLETQLDFFVRTGMPQGLINWLKEEGYIDEQGHANFNDCFTAKLSNTSHSGNGIKPVWDSIRHNGLLPECDWHKTSDNLSWEKYYEPIPQSLKDKALKFWKFFDVSYQWIATPPTVVTLKTLQDALKHAPLQLASPTCSPWAGGVIEACSAPANHATEIYAADNTIRDFDSYEPFKKQLALDYPLTYLMQGILTPRTFNLTTEQCRYAWCKRKDLWSAFPPMNEFYQDEARTYSLYDWCREYGTYEMPGVFIDNELDWDSVEIAAFPELELISLEKKAEPVIKKNWLENIYNYFKNLL